MFKFHLILWLLVFAIPSGLSGQSSVSTKKPRQNIPQLIEDLADSDFLTNYSAGTKILKIGKDAAPYLLKALDHKKGKVRLAAIILLDQMEDKRAIPEFERIFKDHQKKEGERAACALSLGRMGVKDASPLLIQGLSENSDTIKGSCALALGILKEEKAVPYLMKLSQDKEKEVGKIALSALNSIGNNAVPELERLLNEGSLEDGLLSLKTLGNIDSEKSVAVLKQTLKSENKYLSATSSYVLSTIGRSDGIAVAIELLKDDDPKIRALAGKTLENIEKMLPAISKEKE